MSLLDRFTEEELERKLDKALKASNRRIDAELAEQRALEAAIDEAYERDPEAFSRHIIGQLIAQKEAIEAATVIPPPPENPAPKM